MTSQARGMPSVELSPETQEEIKQEQADSVPKPEEEMFTKPNVDLSINPAPEPVAKAPIKKPKRKLTEKQLEALRRGREKSIQTRKENARKKIVEAGKKASQDPAYAPPSSASTHQEPVRPAPPPPIQVSGPGIDYDKIINGVTSRLDKMRGDREQREHKVASDINAFEDKIRQDERDRVLGEIDKMQKEDEQKKNSLIAHHHLSKPRPVQSQNPYLYAMEMGAQSRYKRY